jgi:hypothetical protein
MNSIIAVGKVTATELIEKIAVLVIFSHSGIFFIILVPLGLVYDVMGTQNCNYDYNVKGCSMNPTGIGLLQNS